MILKPKSTPPPQNAQQSWQASQQQRQQQLAQNYQQAQQTAGVYIQGAHTTTWQSGGTYTYGTPGLSGLGAWMPIDPRHGACLQLLFERMFDEQSSALQNRYRHRLHLAGTDPIIKALIDQKDP